MWFVYILKCCNGSYYTGIAKDVLKRVDQHNKGRGARYTRIYGPVVLKYFERRKSQLIAIRREIEIKKMPRQYKEDLVKNFLFEKMKKKLIKKGARVKAPKIKK